MYDTGMHGPTHSPIYVALLMHAQASLKQHRRAEAVYITRYISVLLPSYVLHARPVVLLRLYNRACVHQYSRVGRITAGFQQQD
jgi:hypothetical protein